MKLYNKLEEYSKTGIYPMHMPGHKRNDKFLNMINPYLLDVTETEGFDNLFHPKEVLKEGMDKAASLYKSRYSNYLVGGSSAGILSGISACVNKGDKVLVARNCHKSVYNAIYLNELKPTYIYPQIDKEFGINCGILPSKVREMLTEHKDIRLIIITSPTYEGVVSDIKEIGGIAREFKIPLLVDEAHGAHLGFHSYFPTSSIELGADITIHSLHKTLPSFTQTGLIHINGDMVDYERVKYYLAIYQSSSPSYILMASIDNCIELLIEEGDRLFTSFVERLEEFQKRVKRLRNLKVLMIKDIKRENKEDACFYNFDPSKILISTKNTNITGADLHDLLLNKYKIQIEMSSTDYIIAMTSICDTNSGFTRLADALLEIDNHVMYEAKEYDRELDFNSLYQGAEVVMSSYEAMNSKLTSVPFYESEGRITGEYIYLYPPGIPALVPGERITKKHINQLQRCKDMGLQIQGLEDYNLKQIKVLKNG